MNSVVEMKHVTKRYGKIEVLKDVSLTCKAGKIYGLIGRNGSGKTVLLKSICGFVLPTSGEVRVQGQLVESQLSREKKHLLQPSLKDVQRTLTPKRSRMRVRLGNVLQSHLQPAKDGKKFHRHP